MSTDDNLDAARCSAGLDDYLGLLERPLRRYRALVFHGASGSGKSSQISLLIGAHPELSGRTITRMTAVQRPPGRHDVLIIDELRTPRDALCLLWARKRALLALIASHIEPRWLAPLLLGQASASFRLDPLACKLERHMTRLGIRYSQRGLRQFIQRFGANYTDLDIVLEAGGSSDLDQALARFSREGRIQHGESGERRG